MESASFDEYGQPRLNTWAKGTPPLAKTTLGYTGHDMDTEYGLINMNARLYDPLLGRFISADSVIGDVYNPQSLNRYSYVLNNPFAYTDPTGHVPFATGYDWNQGAGSGGTGPSIGSTLVGNAIGSWANVGVQSLPATLPVTVPFANDVGMGLGNVSSFGAYQVGTFQQPATSPNFAAHSSKSSWIGTAADIGVGFTPAGIAADIYGAVEGKTFFDGQELSWWERGLGLIPMASEAMAVFRGGIKTVGAVEDVAKELKPTLIQEAPGNLIPTQTKSEMSGSQVKRLTKDMKQNGYDQSKPVDAWRNPDTGRLEI